MYHAQAQLHSCNQFHKRNATHDSEGKDKAYHIFRSSYSLRNKSFKASLAYLQWFNLSETSSHWSALIHAVNSFIKSKCFHVQCLWQWSCDSWPNQTWTLGFTVCPAIFTKLPQNCRKYMFAVQKFFKHCILGKYTFVVQNTNVHRNWPFLHMRAGLKTTPNTNTKYFVLYKSRAVQIVDSRERTRQSGRRLATTVCSPMNYWRQNGFRSSTVFLDFFQPYFFIIQYLDFLPPYFIHSGFSCNSLKGEWSLQGWWWCFSWERRRAEMTNGSWGWWAVRD